MAARNLATYLNDHLAGSTVALDLLEHLERSHAGTPEARFAAELRAEIAADRRELEGVMSRLQIGESRPRKATAWLSEKMTELKLRMDDPADGALRRLEVFDAVSVGIEGKRLLWRALGAAAETMPELRGTDYGRLERRAEEQRHSLETLRLEAAKAALGSDAGNPST